MFGLELFSLAIPVNAFVFLLNWLQFSDGLNRAKQRVNITDSAFLCRGFRLDFGKCPLSFGNVLSELTDCVKLVIREEGNCLKTVLQIMDSAFFLRIAIPCLAPILSHIQIGGNYVAQRVIIRAFDDLLAADSFSQFIQPIPDPANGFLQRCQHLIHADDLSVFVAAFAGNALVLQRGSCRTEMLLRQAIFNALPLKRTHIDALCSTRCFERRVLCRRPILPPDFAVLALVPIDGIHLDALPASVRCADAVSVFVKRVDILRFGQPLPVFVHCAKRQHDVNMRVAVAFVVIKEIADHALVHKFLLTEIADEGEVLLVSQFARQSKEHRTRRLRVDTRFRCVHRVPKRLRIGIRFWRVGWQHDFDPLHAR